MRSKQVAMSWLAGALAFLFLSFKSDPLNTVYLSLGIVFLAMAVVTLRRGRAA